ncbi:MAG TPA: hypothetical protein PKC18_03025 [Lacipirellulaceae bacterium]|nr:hypothetical protein [Lacipirellulaceae bacterium]
MASALQVGANWQRPQLLDLIEAEVIARTRPAAPVDKGALDAAFIACAKQLHPDKGGPETACAQTQAAFATLQNAVATGVVIQVGREQGAFSAWAFRAEKQKFEVFAPLSVSRAATDLQRRTYADGPDGVCP